MHCRDIGSAGFSCGFIKQGLSALIIAATIFSAALADEADPWASLGAEGSVSNFSGVIAGGVNSDPAHVTLDGTDLSWSGASHFQTFDRVDVYPVDLDQWQYPFPIDFSQLQDPPPFSSLRLYSSLLSVRNGGQLTAVNVSASGNSTTSVDGAGSVFNVLSEYELNRGTPTVKISNGGVMNCGSIDAQDRRGKIEVDGAGSVLNVQAILDINDELAELSISNGGTVTCDNLIGSNITIDGIDSRLHVSLGYCTGRSNLDADRPPGIQVRNGGSFLADSELVLSVSTVLDVHDGGYAQIGGEPTLTVLPGTVRVSDGGSLNSFGKIAGHLLVEEGGAVYQRYMPEPVDSIPGIIIPVLQDFPQARAIDVPSVEIQQGGRLVVQADSLCLRNPADSVFGNSSNNLFDRTSRSLLDRIIRGYRNAPWFRVQNQAALHGTIEIKLTGDTIPQSEQMLPLVESLGTMDIAGLKIESAPWLQCTPVVTDDGLFASFQLAGDGTGGQHIGVSSHLSGVIATDIDDVSVVTAGVGQISWSNGCHLVADPEEQPGKLFVGYRGHATLSITGRTIENRCAYVGTHTGGSGKVFVEGPGAKWCFLDSNPQTDDSLWEEGSVLVIGNRGGHGEVAVRNGASLQIADGNIWIGGGSDISDINNTNGLSGIYLGGSLFVPFPQQGETAPSESRFTISGAGSTVTAAGVYFGSLGQKELRIEAGGKLTCGSFGISELHAVEPRSDPLSVVIDGIGSSLECEADMLFYSEQEYSILVSNGARISTRNSLSVKWPDVSEGVFSSYDYISSDLLPADGLPDGISTSGKTVVIDGNGSVWDNSGEYYLYNDAILIARNSGKMNTQSLFINNGNLRLETSARVIVAESILTRDGSIDLQNGGAIHLGTDHSAVVPDGAIVVGNGGELTGNVVINGDLVVESGGTVTCWRNTAYFSVPDEAIRVDSFDLQNGGVLRIQDSYIGPFPGKLAVQGDAKFAGTVEVGIFDPKYHYGWWEDYFPEQPVLFDLITVDGICDWSEATLIVPEDEMSRYIMHEHGLRVLKTPPPGDANGDGLVNDIDATLLAVNWHANGATWGMGDFDLDGDVDGDDMLILAGNWQHTYENLYPWYYHGEYPSLDMSQVPEPSTALLVLTGISILALHKRRRYKRCNDIRWAGFSCGLKKQGLFALIIAASILLASSALADESDPWASLGAEGSIADFSGLIAGLFAFDPDPDAHVTLDGTDLSWSGAYYFRTFDLDEVNAVDPEQWQYQPFGQLNLCTASFSVRNGGQLTAVNACSSKDKLLSVDGHGSVLNVLSQFEFGSDTAIIAISNGGVINCDFIDAHYRGGRIEVDGAGSALYVYNILDMNDELAELSISNGGTVTCDSVIGSYITIDGTGSCLKLSSDYRAGRYNSDAVHSPGIYASDGGSFFADSNFQLESSIVLDVSDGGYAQVGGDPMLPVLPGTVRVANGGELNIFGAITGHLLIEDGGVIYQKYVSDPDNNVIDVAAILEARKINIPSVEIEEGGRMVVQASQSALEYPTDPSVAPGMIVIVDPFSNTAQRLRVQDHAALHGTIEIKLSGDTLPQPEQMLPLVESLGTMDITGLKIESSPWLQCTPVVTDEGLSASFQLVGDGTGGQHIGVGSHLSGVIATDIDDVSVVTAGVGRISWSNGCHRRRSRRTTQYTICRLSRRRHAVYHGTHNRKSLCICRYSYQW